MAFAGIVSCMAVPDRCLTARGYSIAKSALSPDQTKDLVKTLTVKAVVPPTFAGAIVPFSVFQISPTRYYLPTAWAIKQFGATPHDGRPLGGPLPAALTFRGALRPHQTEALSAFEAAQNNGIICLPCGYGKTFTGIAAASRIGRCFLIFVHKEFLAEQWESELKALLPGIRIGRIQGDRCDVGPGFDVAIAMIQTVCSRTFPPSTFERFGLAIFDEVHHLAAEHFSQVLQRVQCRAMLGLTATPVRADGLSKVFSWFLGPICYQIKRRPTDATVAVEAFRYTCDIAEYADVPTNWKGETIRARMINQIANYLPRTQALVEWTAPCLRDSAERKLLVLSDRREHLVVLEGLYRAAGITSVAYYVGGMKQKDLDKATEAQVLLGTFAMASEGMNVPTLNAVLLATPKSNIEQSVGRILRIKPEDRTIQPLIFDIVDATFNECNGQWNRRRKFYKECGYAVKWRGEAPAVNTVDSAAAVEAVAAAVAETTEAVEETSGTHGFILD
jgi:superfamily II DNA or RNA helicase